MSVLCLFFKGSFGRVCKITFFKVTITLKDSLGSGMELRTHRPATGISQALWAQAIWARLVPRASLKTGASVPHEMSPEPFEPRIAECPESLLRASAERYPRHSGNTLGTLFCGQSGPQPRYPRHSGNTLGTLFCGQSGPQPRWETWAALTGRD